MSILIGTHRVYTEREARGFRVFDAGVQGPNVAPPGSIQRIIVRQQLPDHPRSWFWPAPPPVPRQLPFRRPIMTVQEIPSHPRSIFYAGRHPVAYEDIQVFIIH